MKINYLLLMLFKYKIIVIDSSNFSMIEGVTLRKCKTYVTYWFYIFLESLLTTAL